MSSDLYEQAYRADGDAAERYGGWRALSARAKADHVETLAAIAQLDPASVLDVGCGDGALLAELAARGFVPAPDGVEISRSAVSVARGKPGLGTVSLFDGESIPADDDHYELGVLSHVLEHVDDPRGLLAETSRVCRAVVVEVPLEANVSARRGSKRATADEVGHIQRFSRESVRALATDQGLQIVADLADPLSRGAQTYFADGTWSHVRGAAKALVRRAAFTLGPRSSERLFTVHYAYLCRRPHQRDVPRPGAP